MNPLKQLEACGQSVWLDYLKHSLIESGELRTLIERDGLKGVTSNPSIFEKAIGETDEYAGALRQFQAQADHGISAIYEHLAIADIRAAAAVLRPVYEQTQGRDGYISLECSPYLANDTGAERFALNMPDIAEVWRRGSVISSWLLDLGAAALAKDPQLKDFSGYVQDSGEGRWTVEAAIEEAVPADVLSTALYARFRSRQEHNFGEKMLSAMRFGFGGHIEGNESIDPEPKSKESQGHSAAQNAAE
jgi:hypothetical protein